MKYLNNRDHSVTISKAIAIILMVYGHSGGEGGPFLTLVRMPLFFFMSGFCFKSTYLDDAQSYIQKRIKGVYWPYVKWGIFFIILHNVFLKLYLYSESTDFSDTPKYYYSLTETIKRIFCVCFMNKTEQLLGGFWFLKSLFWGSLIFYTTRKLFKNQYIGCLSLLCATTLISFFSITIPFLHIDSTDFLAASFIMSGHIFKALKYKDQLVTPKIINNWIYIASFTLIIFIVSRYCSMSMIHYKWNQAALYFLIGTLGALSIFSIGNYINKIEKKNTNLPLLKIRKFLIYVGGNTFNILTWHFISFKLVTLIIIYIFNLQIEELCAFPVLHEYADKGWWIIYSIVGVGLPLMGNHVIEWFQNKNS